MTISSETRKAGPTVGNGVATAFPFAFKVFSAADLAVTLTTLASGVQQTLTLTTDYTVALNPDQNANPGGTVTYTGGGTPMPATQTLTIGSVVSRTQGTRILNGGAFLPENIENMVDRAVINIQQEAEKTTRSLKFPIVDASLNAELPTAALRANMYLAFDAAGIPTLVNPAGGVLTDAVNVSWLPLGTGAVARDVQATFRTLEVDVENFGAVDLTTNPSADSTVAIQKAIDYLESIGGGILRFPRLYRVTQVTVESTGIIFQGRGRSTSGLWIDSGAAGTFAVDVNPALATQNSFSMRDMGIFGNTTNATGADTARKYSGLQLNNIYSGEIRNVFFQGLNNPLKGKGCYGVKFDTISFEQYNIGITGGTDPATSFAENTFLGVRFNDGNTVATTGHPVASAVAILDTVSFNSNQFIGCVFAGTSLAQVDMSNSYGGNTFIQCRFERMKAASTWLKLGSYNRLINCAFYTDGVAIWYDAANPTTNWAVDISGRNNTIDGIAPEYWRNVIRLQSTSRNNDVRLAAFGAAWLASTVILCPINDQGSHNTVRVGTDDYTSDNGYCKTDRPCNNFFLQSDAQGAVTVSGLTKAYATVGGAITQTAAQGPLNMGNCFKYTAPGGNRRWSQTIANTIAGHYYTFSCYVWSITADQDIELICGNSLADANAYAQMAIGTGMFQRVFGIVKATGVTIEVGMRLDGASNGVIVTAPNIMDCGTDDNDIIVGAYLPTINGAGSSIRRSMSADPFNNLENESQPDTGTWGMGKFVKNLNPVEATQVIAAANVKYVVHGWTKITDGTANVVNTDWLQVRGLTGN